MFEPASGPLNHMSLAAFSAHLATNPLVVAVVAFGSTVTGINTSSDYDLLIIVSSEPPARSGITWVAGRLTDLVFASVAEIQALPPAEGEIATSPWATLLSQWLPGSTALFDRAGVVARAVAVVPAPTLVASVSIAERTRRWDHANYNVEQTRRYALSADTLYQRAFDLRMTYQLAEVMTDYFLMRKLRWPGEKDAIRYWETSDPSFLRLLGDCLDERDRPERFELYEQLVAHVMEPHGGRWPGQATFVTPRDDATTEEANAFWRDLIGDAT